VLACVAGRFLFGNPALFGRFRESHLLPVCTQHAAPVDGALEPAQCTVYVLFVTNVYAYANLCRQNEILLSK